MPRLIPNLWFDTDALPAAEFYTSIFPNSEITNVSYYGGGAAAETPAEFNAGDPGTVLTVAFTLDGQSITGINGGPMFTFSEAVSLMIDCADQDEVDYYWEKLGDGGSYQQCGWLKDRFGFSWQVVPAQLGEIMSDPDPERAGRAAAAMMQMVKLDVAALRAAADGA